MTFQGKPKPLIFQENVDRFKRFVDKLRHIVVEDMPLPGITDTKGDANFWAREYHQRGAIRRGLHDAAPDDIIMVSDCDEIISRATVNRLRASSGFHILDMAMYQFFFNMQAMASGWKKPFAYTYALDQEIGDYSQVRADENVKLRTSGRRGQHLLGCGWHFTFLGGAARVKEKLRSYSHVGGWHGGLLEENVLAEQMVSLREVGGSKILRFKDVDASFPESIRARTAALVERSYIKSKDERFQDLEDLWAISDLSNKRLLRVSNESLARLRLVDRTLARRGISLAQIINRVPSVDFKRSWSAGMQVQRAERVDFAWPHKSGRAIMQHVLGPGENRDANAGYFEDIPVEGGQTYTASCFVWLSGGESDVSVDLTLDDWWGQEKTVSRRTLSDQWQRIATTGTAPSDRVSCNAVIRVFGDEGAVVLSTCWQFEESEAASEFCAPDEPERTA